MCSSRKVACTTVFYTLVDAVQRYNQLPYYKVQQAGDRYGIEKFLRERHCLYPVSSLDDVARCSTRIAIVRDPVDRIVSVYRDRIVKKNRADLSWEQFIKDFDSIRRDNEDIHNHSHPQTDHLGMDSTLYSRIYDISEIHRFTQYVVCELCLSKTYRTHRRKRVHADVPMPQVTDRDRDFIGEYYKEDYAVYGDYFGKTNS